MLVLIAERTSVDGIAADRLGTLRMTLAKPTGGSRYHAMSMSSSGTASKLGRLTAAVGVISISDAQCSPIGMPRRILMVCFLLVIDDERPVAAPDDSILFSFGCFP